MALTNNAINSKTAGVMVNSQTGSIFGRTITAGASGNITVTNGSGVAGNPTIDLTTLTAHGILVGEGASAINPIVLTNGQVLIGSTGADPVAATLTGGTGISITNAAGAITINAIGEGLTWNDITSGSATMVPNNGYLADFGTLVTLTLPVTAAQFTVIRVQGNAVGGWLIAQNIGQTINFSSTPTTTGTGGSLASTNQYDAVELICVVANTTWNVMSAVGNLTVS